jgi:hypothetical protein
MPGNTFEVPNTMSSHQMRMIRMFLYKVEMKEIEETILLDSKAMMSIQAIHVFSLTLSVPYAQFRLTLEYSLQRVN